MLLCMIIKIILSLTYHIVIWILGLKNWLAGVWYPRKIDSPGYHTPRSLGEFLTKIKNILTHSSEAQVGSNYEQTGGQNLVRLSLYKTIMI